MGYRLGLVELGQVDVIVQIGWLGIADVPDHVGRNAAWSALGLVMPIHRFAARRALGRRDIAVEQGPPRRGRHPELTDEAALAELARMARMEMRQRSRPASVIVIQGDTVYITRGERRQSLPPTQAKRVLEHALMLRQPAQFVEQAERWIARNANVAQLPSADQRVTVRK